MTHNYYLFNSGQRFDDHISSRLESKDIQKKQTYWLERKDGTLVQKTLFLNDTVENILKHIVSSLSSLGGVTLSPPPPPPEKPNDSSFDSVRSSILGSNFTANVNNEVNQSQQPQASYQKFQHKDRNLFKFLSNISPKDIATRKTHRIDAHAAALIARRTFSFQSIDGTRIHWSSHSMAKLLQNVTQFFDEYSDKFHVSSFYPLSLEISNQEGSKSICMYSGKMYLNPSSTPEQWLQTFLQITKKTIETFKLNQRIRMESTKFIQQHLGIQIKQGLSCDSKEYYECLLGLYLHLQPYHTGANKSPHFGSDGETNDTIASHRIQLSVESSLLCRRPRVTHEGVIQIGSLMSPSSIVSQISKLTPKAYQQTQHQNEIKKECEIVIKNIQLRFGLTRIYRLNHSTLKNEEFLDCLLRLSERLEKEGLYSDSFTNTENENERDNKQPTIGVKKRKEIYRSVVGQALGVTNKGQFCHLGDDGSIIIPSDFW